MKRIIRPAVVALVLLALVTPIAPARAAEDGFRTKLDLIYARLGDRELHVDLYLPPKSVAADPPLVVWIHGGGWRGGNKKPTPAAFLVLRGYAVASVEYRFSQEATYPAQAHDVKAAIRYLRGTADDHGYDAKRIGVIGASAGGHLSMLLGTSAGVAELEGDEGDHDDQSSRVQAVVNLFGPSDLVDFEAIDEMKPVAAKLVAQLIGEKTPTARALELARLASPSRLVTPDDAPLLSLHGDKDKLVPLRQSERIDAEYKKLNLDGTLHVVKGAGHGGGQFASPAAQQMIVAFFDKHVKNPRD